MNVRELTQDQLYELKSKIYWMSFEEIENEYYEVLDDEIILDLEKATYPNNISNESIYKLYDGINFTNDDFFCNKY